ncbi:MAG: glycoside hydrolase family 43 protein [Bacteroidaceae bacterium]|nr:glycoside hydrolase family 43 protein [Bacteroidaceae bacterium]
MKIKQLLAGVLLLVQVGIASATLPATPEQLPDSVYLMAYFTSPAQHLFYAWSTDGLHWQEANGGNAVFVAYDDAIWMRDPYINKVTRNGSTTYHLVHTWGWDNPAIFHWQSHDLIHWTAADGGTTTDSGKIYVMDGKEGRPHAPNAWAPEFTYVPEEDMFYIYWSSRVDDRQLHYVTSTRDWVTFSTPRPLFDPGFTAIDLTVVREDGLFYGYYKDERNGKKTILLATTTSLDPAVDVFVGAHRVLPDDYNIEVEGPTVFRRIGGDGYIGYFDKFNGDAGLSYMQCTTLSKGDWQLIPDANTLNVHEVKHGSVVVISREELLLLLK